MALVKSSLVTHSGWQNGLGCALGVAERLGSQTGGGGGTT